MPLETQKHNSQAYTYLVYDGDSRITEFIAKKDKSKTARNSSSSAGAASDDDIVINML